MTSIGLWKIMIVAQAHLILFKEFKILKNAMERNKQIVYTVEFMASELFQIQTLNHVSSCSWKYFEEIKVQTIPSTQKMCGIG